MYELEETKRDGSKGQKLPRSGFVQHLYKRHHDVYFGDVYEINRCRTLVEIIHASQVLAEIERSHLKKYTVIKTYITKKLMIINRLFLNMKTLVFGCHTK